MGTDGQHPDVYSALESLLSAREDKVRDTGRAGSGAMEEAISNGAAKVATSDIRAILDAHPKPAPHVVTDVAALLALPADSLVLAGGDVYERTRKDGPNAFRCLHDATDYREYQTESAETVLSQEWVDEHPQANVLFVPAPQDVK